MDLILCHTTADFDTLGAAVGLTRLLPGAKVVLTGGSHPTVRDFLALHRDEYALIERRAVPAGQIRSLSVVDTQQRERLGKAAEWLDLPNLTEIAVYDHHLEMESDIPATRSQIEPVGAATTLIVELLQKVVEERGKGDQSALTTTEDSELFLTPAEATVMALGIHVDTGSLTFGHSTARDARALAWLMEQGASLPMIAECADPGLSPQLQTLLTVALDQLQKSTVRGYTVSWVLLETDTFVPGLSSLASQLMDITESDALLLAHRSSGRDSGDERLSVIGRSQIAGTNLNQLFSPLGGGGHQRAASLSLRGADAPATLDELVEQFKAQIPHPLTAGELMSSPVRTIRPETTIYEAQRILLRYGHSGLSVVNAAGKLVGVISRRDLDIALHHGFAHAPVKGYMTVNLKTITPATLLPEIESLMVTYDIGRLPVLQDEQLVGIVTRTDVLRELHQDRERGKERDRERGRTGKLGYCPLPQAIQQLLRERLAAPMWQLLSDTAQLAEQRGCHLYLVGGGVRDLLLANPDDTILLSDIDLVVDGIGTDANRQLATPLEGAGVELATALQQRYPQARLDIHGQFQTAALLWHKDPILESLWIDIATARTEFYPYPAANPEVEASSIRQDLYRRDFTINALAVRLTGPRAGELLDFFGGLVDLESRQIRVLHANSFIEDPTRIYRAVRFAVRLGFKIDPQTEGYIRHAIESGVYERAKGDRFSGSESALQNQRAPALETRLKSELKYILQAAYWKPALQLLGDLGALKCIHPTLELDQRLWKQVRLLTRCLQRLEFLSLNAQAEVKKKLPDHWQMRLEVLIAYLAAQYRVQVATALQLPADSIERLRQFEQAKIEVVESLPSCQRPSQIVRLLRRQEIATLILIAVQSSRGIRRQIWQYLTQWSHVQPVLNGNDLKALGYKPGPQYKEMLDALLAATLDGIIDNRQVSSQEMRAGANAFLREHFPLSDHQ
ncbi:MAG: CBS domain-containing protein [Microcoleus vaginatus WJT46-NPBG5]|jgi:tRNA nucleotidyltransferase (CCA-adding enzyme)|nr:CBS domain-containing protein [Microcoleus vaginatus WJT46-NPBG5]